MLDNFELITRLSNKVSEFETKYANNIASYFTDGLAGYNNLQYFIAQSKSETPDIQGPSNLEQLAPAIERDLPALIGKFQPYISTYNQFYEDLLTLLTQHDPYTRTTLDMSRDELKTEYNDCVLDFVQWPHNAVVYFQFHEPVIFEPEYRVEELKKLNTELQALYKSVIKAIEEKHPDLV